MARSISATSAALLCAFVGISSAAFAQTILAPHRPDPDEYSIYSLTANMRFKGQGVTRIAILNNIRMPGFLTAEIGKGERQFEAYLRETVPGVHDDTAADFYGKAEETGILGNGIHFNLPYFFLTDQDVSAIFAPHVNGWQNFYQKYPGAGLMAFSPIGFDSARRQALVYYGDQQGDAGGSGNLVLLTKKKRRWVIVKQIAFDFLPLPPIPITAPNP